MLEWWTSGGVRIRDLETVDESSITLGAASIEKTTTISASGQNFLDPSQSPTNENVCISHLKVIIKFIFF